MAKQLAKQALTVLCQVFLLVCTLTVFVQASDPVYPELGENERLNNKVDWPNMGPDYKEPPSKVIDPWFLVLQSKSKMDCSLTADTKYECSAKRTEPAPMEKTGVE